MGHLPALIQDLALILTVGAAVTLLFKRIRQPLVLGYIIAGMLVGPYSDIIPTVADSGNVETLAEIGIIFLLFSLGLEFNIKKLIHIGGSASITALVEISFITLAGYILGQMLGWSLMDSVFLGAMLASSSTTIIIKAFDDLGMKTRQFVRVVFGVLIVEDIVVILLLVLLPTLAITQRFQGMELLITIGKLFFFLILMVVVGVFALPTFMKRAKRFLNDETLLIFSIGLCLAMVVIAVKAGFSAELGAFIMGFILAETSMAEKVERVTKPVKDLFAAVFFVSIGMMIDPGILIRYGWIVLAVTLLTVFGKLASTTAGALLSGQTLRQSFHVGMSMAQIGEFAFIVATLGLSLGVVSDFLFPVAVGASAVTTFTTPYMIKHSDRLYQKLEQLLPASWLRFLNAYSRNIQSAQSEKTWRAVIHSYLALVATNGIIIMAFVILSLKHLLPFVQRLISHEALAGFIGLVITLFLISPFMWGLMAKRPHSMTYKELWTKSRYNRGPLIGIELLRMIAGLAIVGFLVHKIFSVLVSVIVIIPALYIVLLVFSKRIRSFYQRLENRLVTNIDGRSREKEERPTSARTPAIALPPWDAHIVEMEVAPQAGYVGKSLQKLAWRERYGVNIAFVKRGDELICFPTADHHLFPGDRVGIIGTDDQIEAFTPVFTSSAAVPVVDAADAEIVVRNLAVTEQSMLKGLSIKASQIREKTSGLVIGIERNDERILNPVSSTVFERGDVVWLAGERAKIQRLEKALQSAPRLRHAVQG